MWLFISMRDTRLPAAAEFHACRCFELMRR
jgi:hypothetical protein